MSERALIVWQIFAVGIVAVGWGFWVAQFTPRGGRGRRNGWPWWAIAGFIAHALFLQSLVYLNVPLRWSAWLGLAIGLAGCVAMWRHVRRAADLQRDATAPRELVVGLTVAALALLVHLALPLALGPSRFFGNGRYDQANYVVTAQFLVDEQFSTPARDIGLRPWLVQPIEKKEERITQSVAHGACAAVSGGDAQIAYAATVAVFMALLAAATFGWLRGLAVPRDLSAAAALLAALAPGVIRVVLDGFFSQAATLFVLPALAGVLAPHRAIDPPARLVATLLVAFVFGAYTEIAAVSVGLVAALVAVQNTPVSRRLRDLLVIVGGALVLNPGYTMRLPGFLALQWGRARDPLHLATYFPDAGTWAGFGRSLIAIADGRLATGVGLTATILMLGALAWQPRVRRSALFATLIVPVVTLALLGLRSPLPAYPFAKLIISFTPLWVGFVAVAAASVVRQRAPLRFAVGISAVLAVTVGAASAGPQYRRVLKPDEMLAVLESAGVAHVRHDAFEHPERSYLVVHDDPLVAQWLCYFARRASVYFDRRHLGDRVVTTEAYAFRRLPAAATELWWLDPDATGKVTSHEAAVDLAISGAAATGETDRARFYLVGESLGIVLTRDTAAEGARAVWLDLALTPLPGAGECAVELFSTRPATRQRATARLGGWVRFRITLAPGRTNLSLRIRSAQPMPVGQPIGLLQAVSVESVDRRVLPSDPTPAIVVE